MEVSKFNFTSLEQLQATVQENGLGLGFSTEYTLLREPVQIGEKQVPNRFVIQPMEGFDSEDNGAPGELTFRRYERYARGGAGLIWFEAVAILEEGRTNPHQLILSAETLPEFKELVEMTRKIAVETWGNGHLPYTVLQLTHSGRFSKPHAKREPVIVVHDPVFDKVVGIDETYPVITDERLEEIQDEMVICAKLAYEAGFDAVDIKACHRYLLSELLGARDRAGKYGGSYENRTRFLKETLQRIREEVPQITLAVRLNASDLVYSGNTWGVSGDPEQCKIDLQETKRLVCELQDLGVKLLNITAGTPYYNPHINRPYDQTTKHGYAQPEHPLLGVQRLFTLTEEVQAVVPEIAVVATGYSWLRQFAPAAAAWNVAQGKHRLIGLGRQAFAYPDLPKDLFTTGQVDGKRSCITCSKCSQLMIWGSKTGCVVRDGIYTPVYQFAAEQHG